MDLRPILLALPLVAAPLEGQSPDSSDAATPTIRAEGLPIWTAPAGSIQSAQADSLKLALPPPGRARGPLFRAPQLLGLGAALISGALSYYYHQQAEEVYAAYRTSGDPGELDDLFAETQRLDRLAGWFYAGAEASLVVVAVSFTLRP